MAFDPIGRFGRFVARSGRPPGRPRALARRDVTGIPVSVLPPGGRQGARAEHLPYGGSMFGPVRRLPACASPVDVRVAILPLPCRPARRILRARSIRLLWARPMLTRQAR